MNKQPEISVFTASPSQDGINWFVWDFYRPQPPAPVFIGSMEDAGLVADALNKRIGEGRS